MAVTFGALAGKLRALRRQISSEATPRPCDLNLLGGEGTLPLLKNSAFQHPVSSLWQVVNGSKGTEHSGGEDPSRQGGRGGLITPRLLGTQVDSCARDKERELEA